VYGLRLVGARPGGVLLVNVGLVGLPSSSVPGKRKISLLVLSGKDKSVERIHIIKT
jgi:hypothetical protein